MLGSLGTALGGYAGGFYLSHFEITRLWLPFLLLSLAGAATVLSLSNNKREYAAAPVSLSEGLRELLGNRLFLLFLIACFFVNQTLTAYNSFLCLLFRRQGELFTGGNGPAARFPDQCAFDAAGSENTQGVGT